MKELLRKDAAINLFYDLEIYVRVGNFVDTKYDNNIDHDLMTKLILRKITKTYGKFIAKKTTLEIYRALLSEIEQSEDYQSLLSSITSLNHIRYSEIHDIHLNRAHEPTLELQHIISTNDLVKHILYKFFSKLKSTHNEEFKSIILNLLTLHQRGNSIEETISILDPALQSLANSIFLRIGTNNLEAFQNFFTLEDTDRTETSPPDNHLGSAEAASFPSALPTGCDFDTDSRNFVGVFNQPFLSDGHI
jgi:hypothetical protein